MLASPINIKKWLEENGDILQPPVNNYCLQRGGFTIMVCTYFLLNILYTPHVSFKY